jgi:hypothetical protein
MTAGEGGGAASPAGSGHHFFSPFFSFFLVQSLGSCWLCMRIYEELCLNLVGSCLKQINLRDLVGSFHMSGCYLSKKMKNFIMC